MIIPTWGVAPFFLLSFVLLGFQYFRINPDRRLLDLRFGLMTGAILLMLLQIFTSPSTLSVVLFGLGVLWLVATLVLLRNMPPPRH